MFINTEQKFKSSLYNKNIKCLQIVMHGSAGPKSQHSGETGKWVSV